MTDQKQRSGVSGDTISFIGDRVNNGHEHVAALGGAIALHNALSREARTILAEFEHGAYTQGRSPHFGTGFWFALSLVKDRLGLDMESEDECPIT